LPSANTAPAFTIQDWGESVFRKTRAARCVPAESARLPSEEIQKPKSQHRQWGSRMSLILKSGKIPNPGKIAFHTDPKSAP
jgi:hypothetical protein